MIEATSESVSGVTEPDQDFTSFLNSLLDIIVMAVIIDSLSGPNVKAIWVVPAPTSRKKVEFFPASIALFRKAGPTQATRVRRSDVPINYSLKCVAISQYMHNQG